MSHEGFSEITASKLERIFFLAGVLVIIAFFIVKVIAAPKFIDMRGAFLAVVFSTVNFRLWMMVVGAFLRRARDKIAESRGAAKKGNVPCEGNVPQILFIIIIKIILLLGLFYLLFVESREIAPTFLCSFAAIYMLWLLLAFLLYNGQSLSDSGELS